MRVDFKFDESASKLRRDTVVDKLRKLGATHVAPQFPGEQDGELASMYKAEGVPDAHGPDVCKELAAEDAVEYAEPSPERTLID